MALEGEGMGVTVVLAEQKETTACRRFQPNVPSGVIAGQRDPRLARARGGQWDIPTPLAKIG
jgi:hypothetical protein